MAYEKLITTARELSLLASTASVLRWDEQTHLMPPKGRPHRANQISLIARLTHERFTSREVGGWIDDLEGINGNSDESINVHELRRAYDRAAKLPASLVEEISKTSVLANAAWVEARKNSHYPTFQPWLEKLL